MEEEKEGTDEKKVNKFHRCWLATLGRQVIMSFSHKLPLCPPTLSLSFSLITQFNPTKPHFLTVSRFRIYLLTSSFVTSKLPTLLFSLFTDYKGKRHPPPSSHQCPRGPLGEMDRSEKKQIQLIFLQAVIFLNDHCIKYDE